MLDNSDYDIWGKVKLRNCGSIWSKKWRAVFFDVDKPSTWRDGVVATATKGVLQLILENLIICMRKLWVRTVRLRRAEHSGFFVNGHIADISMKAELRGLGMIEIILDVVQIIVSTGIIVVLLKDRKCK